MSPADVNRSKKMAPHVGGARQPLIPPSGVEVSSDAPYRASVMPNAGASRCRAERAAELAHANPSCQSGSTAGRRVAIPCFLREVAASLGLAVPRPVRSHVR